MSDELKNRVAVITGASQGIGKACALALAEAGADIAFTYGKNHKIAEETAAILKGTGSRVLYSSSDAANHEDTEKFMKKVMDKFGQIDVLVNNVGGADTTPNTGFADMPLEYWHCQFEKNFFSALRYSQLALKSMIPRKKGSIINIGSVHASRVINLNTMPYACAKKALNHLTCCMAVELAPENIRVNCVAPGLIKTRLTVERYDESRWDTLTSRIPMARAGTTTEVADIVMFLASDKSSYITGQIIGIDGGRTL